MKTHVESAEWWPSRGEVDLIRESFLRLIPHSVEASERFYETIFTEAPAVRPLFPEDMEAQQDKFVQMLAFLVDRLDSPEEFRAECAALGEKHVGYGATPGAYPLVGSALLTSFGEGLSDHERMVWSNLYDLISAAMLAPFAEEAAPPPADRA